MPPVYSSTFALPLLYEDVQAQFEEDLLTAFFAFGKREPAKQINQGTGRANRVVFMPGIEGGKAGSYGPARFPGYARGSRPLATFLEQVTVYCWAADTTDLNDEAKQYSAARDLHDSVVRAIYLSPNVKPRNLTITDPAWVAKGVERTFGAEIKFVLTLEAAILDEPSVLGDTPTEEVDRPVTATVAEGETTNNRAVFEQGVDENGDPIDDVIEDDTSDTTIGT